MYGWSYKALTVEVLILLLCLPYAVEAVPSRRAFSGSQDLFKPLNCQLERSIAIFQGLSTNPDRLQVELATQKITKFTLAFRRRFDQKVWESGGLLDIAVP